MLNSNIGGCMKFLDKYKNTLVKLCTPNLTNEVWGILLDVDKTSNYIKLGKGVIISNKFTLDPAGIFDKIIRYKYDASSDGTLTTPLNPLYNNDGNDSVSWICLDNWIFVPIHLASFYKTIPNKDNKNEQRQAEIVSTMTAYIDAVYNDYDAVISNIDNVMTENGDYENIDTNVDINNDEQYTTKNYEDN